MERPSQNLIRVQYFGEFRDVNPPISDAAMHTFMPVKTSFDIFFKKKCVITTCS
jgi:hypothetical protein